MRDVEVDRIIRGDCLEVLRQMPSESVDCVVTSPPYWGLRFYGESTVKVWDGDPSCEHEWGEEHIKKQSGGVGKTTVGNYSDDRIHYVSSSSSYCVKCGAWKGSLGLEPTFQLYLDHLLLIFDEVKRVLKRSGTCFVNLGDTYSGGGYGQEKSMSKGKMAVGSFLGAALAKRYTNDTSVSSKCLCLIPERFAIQMVDQGWILRNTIVWNKVNHMPESVRDRFTKSWEYLFMFCKAKVSKGWIDYSSTISEINLSWLAAMIDGEGNISIGKYFTDTSLGQRPRYSLMVEVSNTDKRIVEHCRKITGLGSIQQNKQIYRWVVSDKMAVPILKNAYPFLIIKREQAKVALKLQELKREFRKGMQRNGREPLSDFSLEQREKLYILNKRLNAKEILDSGFPEPDLALPNKYVGCEDYWFDLDSVREPLTNSSIKRITQPTVFEQKGGSKQDALRGRPKSGNASRCLMVQSIATRYINPKHFYKSRDPQRHISILGKTPGDVWTINTKPFPEAHFATFPPDLPKRCIKAGCPQWICRKCGKPRERISQYQYREEGKININEKSRRLEQGNTFSTRKLGRASIINVQTLGWSDCGCGIGFDGGIVLDPFCGSGTTCLVAKKVARNFIGIDMSPDYCRMAQHRLSQIL